MSIAGRRAGLISTHALREEGDATSCGTATASSCYFYPRPPRGGRRRALDEHIRADDISTHALREEGDIYDDSRAIGGQVFLPTPSARRATPSGTTCMIGWWRFLPTPSARRATPTASAARCPLWDFYPRPPRGGRLAVPWEATNKPLFLPPPSAWRATLSSSSQISAPRNFYPRPPRGGRRHRIRVI